MADYMKFAEFLGIPDNERKVWVEGYTRGREDGEQKANFDRSNDFHHKMLEQFNYGRTKATEETVRELFNILDDLFSEPTTVLLSDSWINHDRRILKKLVDKQIFGIRDED